MMRSADGESVVVERPREKGVFLFALVFLLVALCSLSLYYAQLGLTEAPVAAAGSPHWGEETPALSDEAVSPGSLRSEPGAMVGWE